MISSQRIDISALSPELLEVMTPLFCELEELGRSATAEDPPTLDLEEFLDALGRLYDQVALPQKHIIMQETAEPVRAPPQWTNMTFKP